MIAVSRGRVAGSSCVAAAALAVAMLLAVIVSPRLPGSDAPGLSAGRAAAALVGQGDPVAEAVVWPVRAPRVALAALVGAALALAGHLLQLLLRNPLADPFVLGVSSGAALASVAALALGLAHPAGRPVMASAGALAAALLVSRLARGREGALSGERLVLAGVVLSYLMSAGIMWILSLAGAVSGQRYLFWLMGSVASASATDVALVAVPVVVAAAVSVACLPALNLLAVSEEHAADSGVAVESIKVLTFGIAAVLTGAAVAVAGSIGFVGLVVPHASRLVVGPDARMAPVAALAGACFLVVADWGSRALGEVPLGVVTATIGAPVFLWLLVRRAS